MYQEVKLELIFLLPIFLPFLTAVFLFLNKKLFNELITNFFTLNSALLSFAIAAYSFIALGLDKFKPVNVELFQWISNPDISIGFTLDGLSGIMLILVTGCSNKKLNKGFTLVEKLVALIIIGITTTLIT